MLLMGLEVVVLFLRLKAAVLALKTEAASLRFAGLRLCAQLLLLRAWLLIARGLICVCLRLGHIRVSIVLLLARRDVLGGIAGLLRCIAPRATPGSSSRRGG